MTGKILQGTRPPGISLTSINMMLKHVGLFLVIGIDTDKGGRLTGVKTRLWIERIKKYEARSNARPHCDHEFFKCQVPAGDSCVAIYHDVCRKCRWDKRKGIYMPLDIWKGWALPQLEKLDN